ncbi:inositol monophosphatase family protein [Streptomyces sp. NRRL B-24484]|uniref:inositol monophosphatase family protein n=1 Tax=Streptomyces sp. NRRL B-24484 TaxID=1463833 RepID=UPI000693E156|nr:inositol monophosphatase family protein [Streptomyces sp. NRRL B-24484]
MEKTLSGTIDAVHAVGERLAALQSPAPVPATGLAEAMAAFRAVDGPAAAQLRERLTALRPSAGWCEDELDGDIPAEGEWWVCDATDGAVQYLGGLPHWAVTATLVRDGAAVLSVVHAPRQDATYTALLGGGAHLDGRPIAPLPRTLQVAVAATAQPPTVAGDPVARRRAGESLTAMLGGALAVRNLGPTALQVAQVGAGNLGLFWEYGQDGTNLLPGALIAAEAGAVVTDTAGGPWTAASDGFLAAAPGVHAEALAVLAQVR